MPTPTTSDNAQRIDEIVEQLNALADDIEADESDDGFFDGNRSLDRYAEIRVLIAELEDRFYDADPLADTTSHSNSRRGMDTQHRGAHAQAIISLGTDSLGYTEDEVVSAIETLCRRGEIYEPKTNWFRAT